MGAQAPDGIFFSGAGLKPVVRPPPKSAPASLEAVEAWACLEGKEQCTLAAYRHQEYGLSHHGEPAEEEVIVLEEPERPDESGPRVVRAPRVPTQREIEAHEATLSPVQNGVSSEWRGAGATSRTARRTKGFVMHGGI